MTKYKLTLGSLDLKDGINTYEFDRAEIESDYFTFLDDFFEKQNAHVKVVFFRNEEANKVGSYENEHTDFFITSCDIEATTYYLDFISKHKELGNNFFFFCFSTYKEAFEYCIDLKEGM